MSLDEFEIWYKSKHRRSSSALNNASMVIADLIGIMLSFGMGFFLVNFYDPHSINFRSFITYWPYLPVFILIFQIQGLYPGVSLAPAEELRRICIGSLMAHGGIIFSRYIEDRELDCLTIAFVLSFLLSTITILILRSVNLLCLSKTKFGGIPAVIYGGQSMGRMLVDKLLNNMSLGYAPIVILDDSSETGDEYRGVAIIHDTSIGPEIVKRTGIRMAIVAMSHIKRKELVSLVNNSVSAFRHTILIPDFFGITTIWMSARDFDGLLGLATSQKLKNGFNLFLKRAIDLFVVIFGGIVILPFLLIIAFFVKFTSKGPALYGHKRVGMGGKEFITYKFRTMVIDADKRLKNILESDAGALAEWNANQKLKDDPRVTKFGKFLRKTSLDEFPQILNVLKGEMSLVGPRPIVQNEIEKYGDDFKRIFSVKPGITGLWQVSGRSETDYADRVSFDTYYLQNWSCWMDLWVLYKTIWVVIGGKGAY
jgi:Undecaprenyl-phosphate galactose phosphotransferase WbaP